MLTFFQAAILGVTQGITELFPISSLGHSVLLPGLLGWHVDQNAAGFLTFLVATHFATALVLFFIFWKDWVRIIKGIFRSIAEREIADPDARLGWLLVVATIPAGIAGVLFETQVQSFFISPASAAFFLVLNGFLLLGAEMLRRKTNKKMAAPAATLPASQSAEASPSPTDADRRIAGKLSWGQSVKIGCLQVIALIPGFSRTGSTLAGSLLSGLSHEDALRFSFLLATPIIGAAALLKLPPLFVSGEAAIETAAVGAIAAAIAAYASAKFLTRYFKTNTLTPFAIYCFIIGALSLAILH
jgi:undecaprenyl-diphosphatase